MVAGALGAKLLFAAKPTYFLSTTGSDSNAGTIDAPWATFKNALPKLNCGDRLFVRGGTYQESIKQFSPATKVCTADATIRVEAYKDENPVIKGLLWMTRPSYWQFKNIDVTWDPANSSTDHMVKMTNGVGWKWGYSELYGAKSYAELLVATNGVYPGEPSGWEVAYNCVHDTYASNDENQDHLIYVNGGTADGQSGNIHHNLLFNATNGEGIKLGGADPGNYDTSGITVAYNTVYNTKPGNIMVAWSGSNNILDHNLLVQTIQPGTGNIRGYDLGNPSGGTGNVYSNNAGYKSTKDQLLFEYPAGSQSFQDGGGNVYYGSGASPGFDSTATCSGFHPSDANAKNFGYYAGR